MSHQWKLAELHQLERTVLDTAAVEHRSRHHYAIASFERWDEQETRSALREHELADDAFADAVAEYVAFIDFQAIVGAYEAKEGEQ